jgi:drug/metabolite transporter (DMT)-like permease
MLRSENSQHKLLVSQQKSGWPGLGYAMGAALLFGLNAPLSKVLLEQVEPWMLAGLLFAGGGLGLWVIDCLGWHSRRDRRVGWQDWRLMTVSIAIGGVIAPLLMVFGIDRTSAAMAALLLNFEAVFTALVAWLLFGQRLTWQLVGGIATITAGGIILSSFASAAVGFSWGAIAILGTCLMWGLDSNLTHKIADRDPVQVAMLKSGVAGLINVLIALALGNALPALPTLALTLFLGFIAYGLTLLYFVLALRHIGAARTGAFFALSPFVGAAIAITLLDEPLTSNVVLAAGLMAIGVAFCLRK